MIHGREADMSVAELEHTAPHRPLLGLHGILIES